MARCERLEYSGAHRDDSEEVSQQFHGQEHGRQDVARGVKVVLYVLLPDGCCRSCC